MTEIKKPVIEIGGEKYEVKNFKAKDWREFFKFDGERFNLSDVELIDKHCEIIAKMFGLTAEQVTEEIELADVFKIYHKVRDYFLKVLTSKLEANEKNAETGEN